MTAPLPYNIFGSGNYELGAQESLPQHSTYTYSEEQNLSAPRELCGSQLEVAYPRLGQHTQGKFVVNAVF
jgi:hypothetical protein